MYPCIGRFGGAVAIANDELLTFVRHEVEELVFDYRSAERSSELIVLDLRLGRSGRRERSCRGKRVVAIEVVHRAMQRIGAGLDHHVDRPSAIAAGLGVSVGLHRKLVDGVDGKQGTSYAGNAALIHGGRVVPGVVVVRAVNLPVVLSDTSAIDRASAVNTRGEFHKLCEIATIQRHVLYGLVRNHLVDGRTFAVDGHGLGGHFDSLCLRSDLEAELEGGHLADFHRDPVDLHFVESGLR